MVGPWRRITPPRRPAAVSQTVLTDAVPSDPGAERFTFFWRGPFSNWHPSRFVVDGIAYSHAEQWMMAEKARLFGDLDAERRVMQCGNPKGQKTIGRDVKGFVEEVWQANAKEIVRRGLAAKFSQNEDLLRMLLATEGTTLVEASPYDRIWGIGLQASDPRAHSRETWLGTNWLGEVLTDLRDAFLLEMRPSARP